MLQRVRTVPQQRTYDDDEYPCPRCGLLRKVHGGKGRSPRTEQLCRDCRAVDPMWGSRSWR